jgi:hypothetical protein
MTAIKVDDSLREIDANRRLFNPKRPNEVRDGLIGGSTLFIPLGGSSVATKQQAVRSLLERSGYRLHYYATERNGTKGLIAWAGSPVMKEPVNHE